MLVKSAPQGHLNCENANMTRQHMLCGHKSSHSGSFDGAGGLGISIADGFQNASPSFVNARNVLDNISFMLYLVEEVYCRFKSKFLVFLPPGLSCLLA